VKPCWCWAIPIIVAVGGLVWLVVDIIRDNAATQRHEEELAYDRFVQLALQRRAHATALREPKTVPLSELTESLQQVSTERMKEFL